MGFECSSGVEKCRELDFCRFFDEFREKLLQNRRSLTLFERNCCKIEEIELILKETAVKLKKLHTFRKKLL